MTREVASLKSEVESDAEVETAIATPEGGESLPREGKGRAKVTPQGDDKRPKEPLSPVMRSIRDEEEKSLRDWLDTIGTGGAFKIQLRRIKPTEVRDPKSNKIVKTDGYLETCTDIIDEAYIAQKWGGGTYTLKITRQGSDGSFKYEKGLHRTIDIGGEPLLDQLPSNAQPPSAPVASGEGTVTRELMGFMREQLADKGGKGIDPALQLLMQQMREDGLRRDQAAQRAQERHDSEMAEMRRELRAAQTSKPPEDAFKDRLLGTLVEGESARIEALRLRHESELRTLKESADAELRRARDIAAEDSKRQGERFDRQMAEVRQSHEREIATLRSTAEVIGAATKSSADTQKSILEAEVRRLEREVAELKIEVAELRAKKDKSLIEQVTEIKKFKEALDDGDGDGDKTGFDKAVELINNPAAAEFVKGVFGKGGGDPAAAPPATAQAAAQPKQPVLMATPDGQKFWAMPDGSLRPAKKKPKVIPPQVQADGTVTPEIALPQIDEDKIKSVVAYLERAHSSGQDPEVVAQSGRTFVPEEILAWIRDNHTEQMSGVDLFMTKVAKLPVSSQLSTQSGKNWLRKVWKALIGS